MTCPVTWPTYTDCADAEVPILVRTMASKKTTRSRNASSTGQPGVGRGTSARTGPDLDAAGMEVDDAYLADWAKSRSGANAARGFHFQDVVGAWIATQIADGALSGVLVPEGLDDMTVEATEVTNIQVKSRVLRRGPFSSADAAAHIVTAWTANRRRSYPAASVWVVLENGVQSPEQLDDPRCTLREALQPDSALHRSLRKVLRARGIGEVQLKQLLAHTVVLGPTWEALDDRTDAHLANRTAVARTGRILIARALRTAVANATDTNANPDPGARVGLDRTAIINHINATTEQIDVGALETALRDGVCVALDWIVRADAGDRYYEGDASQPGHVASGLVITRKDLLTQVLAGAEEDRPVVITGPSGIGKSAVLWSVPHTLQGVTWFRVQRLQNVDDVNSILRLTRAYGASAAHPIGLLIDGAGAGQLTGWDLLRAQVAAHQGVMLFATARNEDLVALGDLSGTTTVAVALDEEAAATIFVGLRRRGATTAPHWREAFEQSHGLTLEFTHLLTQGRRLRDVIGDQIRERIARHRDVELSLLALVATAHQWSTNLELARVSEVLDTNELELRRALDRLADEHLVIEIDGRLSGLHSVRSAAITAAIHATPPPVLRSTIGRVLDLVDDPQLPRFIAQALREHPDLAATVLEAPHRTPLTARRLAAFFQGLRLADSEKVIREWITILDEEMVSPSVRPTMVMFALTRTDLGTVMPEKIRAVLERLSTVEPGQLRDVLADRIGHEKLMELMFDSDAPAAAELVATLYGWQGSLQPRNFRDDQPGVLVAQLREGPLQVVADTVAVLHAHDRALSSWVIDRLGGEHDMLEAIRGQYPWILELDVRSSDDGLVGFARILHLDDKGQGEPRTRCVELARMLLRLLPSIIATDVEALLPGRRPIEFGGHAMGVSRLRRENDRNQTEIAWYRARFSIARTLLGTSDTTRLHVAFPTLRDLTQLVREFGTRWVASRWPSARTGQLSQEVARIERAATQMPTSLGRTDLNVTSITGSNTSATTDPLSITVTQFAGLLPRLIADSNRIGPAFEIQDSILPAARKCLGEPWYLIADGEQVIKYFDQLIQDFQDIHDVLMAIEIDQTNVSIIKRTARNGTYKDALRRSATLAKRLRNHVVEERRHQIDKSAAAAAPDCVVDVRTDERDGYIRHAVLIAAPSLFEWHPTAARVVDALSRSREKLERFLILPIRNGMRVDQLGINLIETPMPAVDIEKWTTLLPGEAHPTELAQLASAATEALQILSGISELTLAQREHPEVGAAAHEANEQLSQTIEKLQKRGDDKFAQDIRTTIVEIAQRVQAELDGIGTKPTFAAAVAAGFTGDPTEEWNLVVGIHICAIEWEIDPEQVSERLES